MLSKDNADRYKDTHTLDNISMEKYKPTDPLKNLGHTEYQISGQFKYEKIKLFSVWWSVYPKQIIGKVDSQYIVTVNTLLICQKLLANRLFYIKIY